MAEEDFDDELKKRRRKLLEASKTPRTKEQIENALKPYKNRNTEIIIDDKECVITRHFEALIQDPDNNKKQFRKEVSLTVSGNLCRPIEDFVHDIRWLSAQSGSIQDGQRGIISRR